MSNNLAPLLLCIYTQTGLIGLETSPGSRSHLWSGWRPGCPPKIPLSTQYCLNFWVNVWLLDGSWSQRSWGMVSRLGPCTDRWRMRIFDLNLCSSIQPHCNDISLDKCVVLERVCAIGTKAKPIECWKTLKFESKSNPTVDVALLFSSPDFAEFPGRTETEN